MAGIAKQGKFTSMLSRSNKDLRKDRAALITETAETKFRRLLEDLDQECRTLEIDRANLLDVNPSNTQTILNPSDFDADDFVNRSMKYGLLLREKKIRRDIVQLQYEEYFGTDKIAE